MSIKRGKWERKAAKRAALQTPSPNPADTTALASQGVEINRGNSNQQVLSDQGKAQAAELGAALAKKGAAPDKIVSSTSVRTNQTADELVATDPKQPEIMQDPRLESWAQGNLEGKPKQLVKDQIRDLIRKNPGAKLPGKGALSTKPGESFDDFRVRALSAIRGVMQEKAEEPDKSIVVPLHSSVINLVRAWIANGAPDDLSIKPEEMDAKYGPPGSVVALKPNRDGQWDAEELDLNSESPIDRSAILLARHGMTPDNKENYEQAGGTQQALAQIARHTKNLDFGRANAIAARAAQAGHLSGPEIDAAIDGSLPGAKEAADLPLHKLLAVASAASPQKAQEYAPLIQQYFTQNLGGLPPDARADLAAHLRQIGFGQPA